MGPDVLFLVFSSGLSGSYNSSRMAVEELRERFRERRIRTVDTLAASMGEGLLVWHAAMRRKAGESLDAVANWVENNRNRLCHWFTVDDLHFLRRGGRVSGAAAVMGTMLNIKPVLHVDDEGHLIPMEKVRGRRQSLDALVRHLDETIVEGENATIFLSHGDCAGRRGICRLQAAGPPRHRAGGDQLHRAGDRQPTPGPGTVALFWMGSKK